MSEGLFILDVSNTHQFRKLADQYNYPLARRYLLGKTIEKIPHPVPRSVKHRVAVYNPNDLRDLFTMSIDGQWQVAAHLNAPTLYAASSSAYNLPIMLPMRWLVSGAAAENAIKNFNNGDGYRVTIPRRPKGA